MDKLLYNELDKEYAPIITKIINENKRFYSFNEKIRWNFCDDDQTEIIAVCGKDNFITISLNAVYTLFINHEPLTVEYFLLHEIRHIYQNIRIREYEANKNKNGNDECIEQWIKEQKNYIPAFDENGNENQKYFEQDIEFDAYAFSYAVIKYKYILVPKYIYVPNIDINKFWTRVNYWLRTFRENSI